MNVQAEITELMEKIRLEKKPRAMAILRSVLKDIFNSDLYLFAKYGLGYSEIEWATHGEMIQVLEGEASRKVFCYPRGGFKSTIAVVCYSIFKLNRLPDSRILIDSELFTNSSNFLREIKGHMENPVMEKIFGRYKSKVWNESEIIISQRLKKYKEASITCGGVGTTKVGQHYCTVLGDDYNSPKNSHTPEACEKVISHVKYNLSILEPNGEYIFIGTRYSERDVLGWILGDLLKLKELAEGKFYAKRFVNESKSGLLKGE